MKPILKKKTNPAFKRLQTLPVLPDLSIRLAEVRKYAATPAVVIVPAQAAPDCETKTF